MKMRLHLCFALVGMALAACGGSSGDSDAPNAAAPQAVDAIKAGPAILYRDAVDAPQLQNTGIWQAKPILVSGASAYRNGEFLYQDFLYDDRGATNQPNPVFPNLALSGGDYTYPTDPVYAANAADIVEIRIRPTADATAFRVTYQSMLDPEKVALTIGIGDSLAARPMPHGANTVARAAVFVTVHGSGGDIVDAASGATLPVAPIVSVDTGRRQVEIRVPYTAYDTRGVGQVKITAAAGLWDSGRGAYLIPAATADATHPGGAGTLVNPPAFFNVAFRYSEPVAGGFLAGGQFGNFFKEYLQSATLFTGDISSFYATVDFVKLQLGVNDDMPGQYSGVPQSGFINRILASNFETTQGRGPSAVNSLKPLDCKNVACVPEYAGRLQPYSVYVPAERPTGGYGFVLELHGASSSYTQANGSLRQQQFSNMHKPSIVLTSEARGEQYWYYGQALADVFEAWADVKRNYNIDMNSVYMTGISMGGYGTEKLASMWPDLFTAVSAHIPCPSAATVYNGSSPVGGLDSFVFPVIDSLRNVPIVYGTGTIDPVCNGAGNLSTVSVISKLDSLGYRYKWTSFTDMGHVVLPSYQAEVDYLKAQPTFDQNPPHVTLAINTTFNDPSIGLDADHAYWISDVSVRNGAASYLGTVEVMSHGFAVADPTASATTSSAGMYDCNGGCEPAQKVTTGVQQSYQTVVKEKKWSPAAAAAKANQLDIKAINIGHVTVDVARAQVDCNAVLNITSDGPLTVSLRGCPNRTNESH